MRNSKSNRVAWKIRKRQIKEERKRKKEEKQEKYIGIYNILKRNKDENLPGTNIFGWRLEGDKIERI